MHRAMVRKTMLFLAFLLTIACASAFRSARSDAAQ